MFKFFKLFGSHYLGFWLFGLLLFAVQEIPYMVMPLFKLQTNPIMNMTESSRILDMFEKILGSLCIASMIFIVNKNSNLFLPADGKEKIFFALSVTVLLLNFIGWGIYFSGRQSVFVMMFFYSNYASAVLLFYRALEEKYIADGYGSSIFNNSFYSCFREFKIGLERC